MLNVLIYKLCDYKYMYLSNFGIDLCNQPEKEYLKYST